MMTAASGLAIQTGSTSATEFQPNPLEPTWIVEGRPTARSTTLTRASDEFFAAGATKYWTVSEYVKKFCIHRVAQRSLLAKVRSRVGRSGRRLRDR